MEMEQKFSSCLPEIWGGIECTINRVEDKYRDQLESSGHYERPGDIESFGKLGLRKLRYPVLWEKHQPTEDTKIDWTWTGQQLNNIRENGMDPIVGLVHHGSGPRFTDLTDKNFPDKLAAYATKVAEQFPWINYYTPVNEPLTTARFSGLYGFWYPHGRNDAIFHRTLLNELKGTVLAMVAIRKINPNAQLVQTEDLSFVHSTAKLGYQARYENKRRWLTNDILCGMVDRKHFFWKYFTARGVPEADLEFFLENKCPPDIIGYNYYVTSERYLDENRSLYSPATYGGNKKHRYADTEAVRKGKSKGLKILLQEAWDRYKLPMAVTECHLNCTREEQLRWFRENYIACSELKKSGVDIRGITAWALLGAYDWNSLLTKHNNHYEAGIFDVSDGRPRPTALAKMLKTFAGGGTYDAPLMKLPGWWHQQTETSLYSSIQKVSASVQPLLIIGKTGTLGRAFERVCELRSIPYVSLGRFDIDILDESSIIAAFEKYKPWAMVNATGFVRVDDAEEMTQECYNINAVAPSLLAKVSKIYGLQMISFSSDLVFNGNKNTPYREDDSVLPLNVYGESKARGEELILAENEKSLVIRTSAFFGPWDKYNFVYSVLDALKTGGQINMVDDVIVSPTYIPDLCNAAMDLLIDEEKGIWHISNTGTTTWAAFGDIIAAKAGYNSEKLIAKPLAEMSWKAKRPLYSVLESGKGIKLPGLDHALDRYFENLSV
ncbi:MAG: NAD-dependent epimerase/dehydratase family protein [Chitinophagaceae bacterium]|nr:MAG: NAD-dependent epimerase/dehydratase family protein [Chitinophagaceae bacterium]